MNRTPILLWWGIMITIYAYGIYIAGMIQGLNKPHPFSWMIWCMMTIVAVIAQMTQTRDLWIWIGIVTIAIQIIIIIFSFRYYTKSRIVPYDRYSLIIWILAIVLWMVTGSPLWSVYLLCVADAIGYVPTVLKSRSHPEEEYLAVYIASTIKWTISLILISNHTVITSLYPLYLILANGLFIGYNLSRRYYLHHTFTL